MPQGENMKKFWSPSLFFALPAFLAIIPSALWAQSLSTVNLGSQSPDLLVQDILGIGVAFSNVTYQGSTAAAGTFTGGSGIIGFDSGIILSSGAVSAVKGPAQNNPASTCYNNPGDADLSALAGGDPTYDASVLSFDFIPQYDTLSFQYVFASDEYNAYVGSNYDDVFGFFINGVNEALVPGTTTVVSVNTVNLSSNTAYYINNDPAMGAAHLNTQMYGLTTVLTVTAAVTPGVVNHIKLAIADSGDCKLDSDVFIKASSFTSGPTATPTPSPTVTDTPTVTLTPTVTNTPTITPTFPPNVDLFYVSKNEFHPPQESVSIFVETDFYPGTLALKVYNSAGEFIKLLGTENLQNPIARSFSWDGTNMNQEPCASGIYLICLDEPYSRKVKKVLLIR
jgi:hypothetical protein